MNVFFIIIYVDIFYASNARRSRALSHIKQFVLPEGDQPEHFLWSQLKQTTNYLATLAQEIMAVADDKHSYLYDVQMKSGESREGFLTRLTAILNHEPFWKEYVAELSSWLEERKNELGLKT